MIYSLRLKTFEIYHINEEISHSKCHFSHPQKINTNYIKSQIFFGQKEKFADNRMRVQFARYEKILKISKLHSEYPRRIYFHPSNFFFHQSFTSFISYQLIVHIWQGIYLYVFLSLFFYKVFIKYCVFFQEFSIFCDPSLASNGLLLVIQKKASQ